MAGAWHSWQSPEPLTQRAHFRQTIQVAPISLILDQGSTTAPGTPLPDSSSSYLAAVTPPAVQSTTVPGSSGSKPGSQPLAPAAPGYEYHYGTRLSTVLLIRRDGSVLFIERDVWRLGKDGKPERLDYKESRGEGSAQQRVFEFKLDWGS